MDPENVNFTQEIFYKLFFFNGFDSMKRSVLLCFLLQHVHQDRRGDGDGKGSYDVFGVCGIIAVCVNGINAARLEILDQKNR